MVMDEDNDDGLGGRGRDRREAARANRWSRPLCALDAVQLAAAPVPEDIRVAIRLAQAIAASYPARDRQYRRIDKLVRSLDEPEVLAIDRFLENPDAGYTELDDWLERVLSGDAGIDAWVALHPTADRQKLRTLARNVRSGKGARDSLRIALAASL
jgi:ribosome-associated protein